MSKEELKSEINKVLDHLPDNTLVDILSLLKNITNKQPISLIDKPSLERVLSDDKALLEKLAK